MKFKKVKEQRKLKNNRAKLLSLEKGGKYVFHGSYRAINELEPCQAFNYNYKTSRMEKDGVPAVFATRFADVAIFRALINNEDIIGDYTSEFGIDKHGKLYFSATKNLLEHAKDKVGRVHILDKEFFQNFKNMQCRSSKKVKPIKIIEVRASDLPRNIKVIDP